MADKAANSIRRLFPLRQTGLTQAFDDARALGVEGRVVGKVEARIFLHGEAGIDFLQLRDGLLGLLVMAGPDGTGMAALPRCTEGTWKRECCPACRPAGLSTPCRA
jgi:hypothetical protein